jgi:DNA-binding transcriptional ArsR family regulator
MAKTSKGRAHVVRRLEQVRALAHPLRIRLFEAFARGPKTTKQAAEMLGLPPTRLYHHAQALERAGLIKLKETRPNRGTVEKHYEAVAEQLSLDPDVFKGAAGKRVGGAGSGAALASRVLDLAKDDLESSLRAKASGRVADTPPMALRVGIRAPARKVAAVHRQLLRFVEKIKREAGKDDGTGPCVDASLTIAFVPSIAPVAATTRVAKPTRRRKES